MLPEKWATRRPEELTPEEFIDITSELYGPADNDEDISSPVWRVSMKSIISTKDEGSMDFDEEI